MTAARVLWSLLDAREKRRVWLLQLLSIFMAASTLCGIAALAPFLVVLADPARIDGSPALAWAYSAFGFQSARDFVVALGLAFVLISALTNAVNMAGSLAIARFALDVGDRFHVMLFEEYLRRELLFHVRTGSMALANNIVFAVKRVSMTLIESLELMITNTLVVAGIFASIVYIDPAVGAISAGWLGVAYVTYFLAMRWRVQLAGQAENNSTLERARIVGESLQAIREIQVERSQPFFVAEFARTCRAISRAVMKLQVAVIAPRYLLEILTVSGLVLSAIFVSSGRPVGAWLAELAVIGLAAYRLLPALQSLFACALQIRGASPIFASIAPDLLAARGRAAIAEPAAPDWSGRPRRTIAVERISFRYAHDREAALVDVSLEIPAGALVGVIGANGSGKTTLIDILAGLLTPESGRLLVDEEAVTAATLSAWQSRIAYVPQQVFLLDASVAANIALGVPRGRVDIARLHHALRRARLDEFVARLPRGIDEPVGERGISLSGGQRQRLAIARALYRGAPVLLMDEPTSSLDDLTEQEVVQMLSGLRGQSTVVVVAHGANVIRHCDVVFELEAGSVKRSRAWTERVGA